MQRYVQNLLCTIALVLAALPMVKAESETDPAVVVLFMFCGLGLGIIITQIQTVLWGAIPYTVVIFGLGAIFASMVNEREDALGQSVSEWVNIDADLMLFVFLPPLIFGEAMSLNWHHVKGALAQATLLAGPGVLFGAACMSVLSKFMLPYSWTWDLALTFGSILAATDPVAVVALLKEANASPKLTMMIVGESLLNDGTAMVLFTLFFKGLKGGEYEAGAILLFFLEAVVGSVVLGVIFGLGAVRWLRSLNRPLSHTDVSMQVGVTLVCAYLCFFTAQYMLEISGVLACCGAGAMLAWLAPPIILNHEVMHNIWGMIEWVLNTLIFLLAGLIIGHRTLEHVSYVDFGYVIMLYVFLMVIRFVTISLLYPALSTMGHRCTWNEALFVSWSGLRGALCMALGLIVERDGPNKQDKECSRAFFYIGGVAALTLLINATTAKKVLDALGLLGTDSAEKGLVIRQLKLKLRRKMEQVVTQVQTEFNYEAEDIDEVRMSCSLFNDVNIDELYRDTERASTMRADAVAARAVEASTKTAAASLFDRVHSDSEANAAEAGENHRRSTEGDAEKLARLARASNSPSRSGSVAGPEGLAQRRPSRNKSITLATEGGRSVSRRLSARTGMSEQTLDPELLVCVRGIFLEIIRVRHWHNIESGKLPRLSHSAQYLLYSVEVALDLVKMDKCRDWLCLLEDIDGEKLHMKILYILEDWLPECFGMTATVAHREAIAVKRAVYMLTSFIDAHEHAQRKIHGFIGMEDDHGHFHHDELPTHMQTPEELRIVAESRDAVAQAKAKLDRIRPELVAAIRSKQASRMLLAKEADIVHHMVDEGLLTESHAEEFLEDITHDTQRLEQERKRLYKAHAKERVKQRLLQKEEYRESFRGGALASDLGVQRNDMTGASNTTPFLRYGDAK